MLIRESSLIDRFYVSDGWTRREVMNLIINKKNAMYYVIPRYFDSTKDSKIVKQSPNHKLMDLKPYDDCDYFGIYDFSVNTDYNTHTYQPFKM